VTSLTVIGDKNLLTNGRSVYIWKLDAGVLALTGPHADLIAAG
jgi:hypothetical protein